MKKWISSLAVLGMLVSLGSCYYDKEDELYGGGSCDTTGVTYSTTITGLLNSYGCLGCHVGTSPSGGVRLTTYADVKARVTDNRLLGSITHSPGFSPMPQGAGKMNDCDIRKVRAWINAGAPQN